MATLAEIRTWVRTQTLIESDEVTNTEILALLNQGIEDVASSRRWPFLDATTAITTVASQASYSLPADFSRVEAVYYTDEDLMTETTRRSSLRNYGSEEAEKPTEFYLFQEKIWFGPITSTASQSINLDYQKTPTLLVGDSDTPEWAAPYHLIIAEYAAAKLWEREEDLEKTAYHLGAFRDGIMRMARYYDSRTVDSPVIIGSKRAYVRLPWDWQYG